MFQQRRMGRRALAMPLIIATLAAGLLAGCGQRGLRGSPATPPPVAATAVTATTSGNPGDQVEALLDSLAGRLDQTDTLPDVAK